MNFNQMTDDELKQSIMDTRKNLDEYEAKLNQSDNSVDKVAMRAQMTKLNHLKLEANKRGLDLQ